MILQRVVVLLIGHFLIATSSQLIEAESHSQWICSNKRLCIKDNSKHLFDTTRYESQHDCRLSCGRYGAIWPMPTGVCTLGHERIQFDPRQIRFDVDSPSVETKQFIRETNRIFVNNIVKECLSNCSLPESMEVRVKATIKSLDLTLDWSTDESYKLSIQTKGSESFVDINAPTVYGARHAFETLSNLVTGCKENGLRMVSAARITDRPIFPHRGLLLDTARNFIPLHLIQNTIDAMAASKLNVFHWHAVDSQSFPLEIRRVPEMQQFGAYSASDTYSHSQTVNLIKYARLRGIRVVIEIDGPSHAGFGWQWGPIAGMENMSLSVSKMPLDNRCQPAPCMQLNPVNRNMYDIMKKIYGDLVEVGAPEETIHMGGDEVNPDGWFSAMPNVYLSDNFISTWAKFHKKNLQSWDEVNARQYPHLKAPKPVIVWSSLLTEQNNIEIHLPKERFIIQSWKWANNDIDHSLLQKGYRLIISPNDAWYLDHGFWGRTTYNSWETVYNNKMRTNSLVLGGEVCMWSEYVDENSLEGRIWPRAGAAAERLWSNPATKPIHAQPRFYRYRDRLNSRGINAAPVISRWCVLNEGQCL